MKIKATNRALIQIGVWLKIIKEGTTKLSSQEKSQIEKEFGELLIFLGYSSDEVCKIGDLSKDNETIVCYFEQTKSVASLALLIETMDDFAELKVWTPKEFSRYECHSENEKIKKMFLTSKVEENRLFEASVGVFEERYRASLQNTKGENLTISLSISKYKLGGTNKYFDILAVEKALLETTFPINIDELYERLHEGINEAKLDSLHITIIHFAHNEVQNKIEMKNGVLQTFIKDGHSLVNNDTKSTKTAKRKKAIDNAKN